MLSFSILPAMANHFPSGDDPLPTGICPGPKSNSKSPWTLQEVVTDTEGLPPDLNGNGHICELVTPGITMQRDDRIPKNP